MKLFRCNFVTLGLLLASLASPAFAQTTPVPSKEPPKTQLEAVAAETGVVIIKGISDLGSVGGVAVECREYTNTASGKKSYGMVIKVTETGGAGREESSAIDYDELPALLAGMDYLGKIKPDVTKLKRFEATYATKGGFSVIVLNNAMGDISVSVSAGHPDKATVSMGLDQFAQLRAYLQSAKQKIDSIK